MKTVLLLLSLSLCPTALSAAPLAKVGVTWLGHAAFEIESPKGTRILIDPFLVGNPSTPASAKKLSQYKPDAILVSHAHGDHVGNALEIAKSSGAPIVGAHDYVSTLSLPTEQLKGGNVGGHHVFKDLTVHFVPAMHGSTPGGRPLGFVIEVEGGPTIYHSGDTWIFGDMALINDIYRPSILLLNAGGGPYTQNPKVAALGVKKYFSHAKTVIPMHFATFPPLAKEAEVKKAFAGMKGFRVLRPGEKKYF